MLISYLFYLKEQVKRIAPWKWGLILFWFASQMYVNRTNWGSGYSYFDLMLAYKPGWHLMFEMMFPFILMLVFSSNLPGQPVGVSETQWRDEQKPWRWIIGQYLFIFLSCLIILILFLAAGLLICVLSSNLSALSFANRFSAALWDGLPFKPWGSLYTAFSVYIVNFYLYLVFFAAVILFINTVTKNKLGVLFPAFWTSGTYLIYSISSQTDFIDNRLSPQAQIFSLLFHSWEAIAIWLAIIAGIAVLLRRYLRKRHGVQLESQEDTKFKTSFKRNLLSPWFGVAVVCFVGIVSFGIWNQWKVDMPWIPKEFAGLNLFVFGNMELPSLLLMHGYFFVALACIPLYRRVKTEINHWRGLLYAGLQGLLMFAVSYFVMLLLFILVSGKVVVPVPLYTRLFIDVIAQSWFAAAGIILCNGLAIGFICGIFGYAVCRLLSDWKLVFSFAALFWQYSSQAWFFLWNGGAIGTLIPIDSFATGALLSPVGVRIKSLLFACIFTGMLMAISGYLTRRKTDGKHEDQIA